MDIKEKIHELSEEMIQNLGRLVAVSFRACSPIFFSARPKKASPLAKARQKPLRLA